MLAFWSRTAQAHSCTCQACTHAANAIARRSGPAVSRSSRRKITVADVFTACYTGIMATAAVIDASHKDKRRKHLDRRIDEAKASLAKLLEESTARDMARSQPELFTPSPSANEPPWTLPGALSSICLAPDRLLQLREREQKRQVVVGNLHVLYRLDRRKSGGKLSRDFRKIEAALAVEEDEFEAHREPSNEIQLSKVRDMVNDLVDELLLQAHREDEVGAPGLLAKSLNSLDSAFASMGMLRSEGQPRYVYPQDEAPSAAQGRRVLNEANNSVLWHWDKDRKRHPVARICYNLLVSKFPPSIHTYNSLILGLSRLREHGLADIVVNSFLYKSKLRPTQQTLVCLLLHYRLKNDILGFYSILRRIVGKDSRGFLIRRKTMEEVATDRSLQRWATNADVRLYGGYFVERGRQDSDVFEALIKGLLHFDQVEHAATALVVSLRQKVDVTVETLIVVLNRCVDTVNHVAARTLVRGFVENLEQITAFIASEECSKQVVVSINRLLAVSGLQPGNALLRGVNPDGGSTINDYSLSILSCSLLARDVQHRIDRTTRMCRNIIDILRANDRPVSDRISVALDVVSRIERHALRKEHDNHKFWHLAILNMLDEHCHQLERRIRTTKSRVLDLMSRNLPEQYKKLLRCSHISLHERLQFHVALLSQPRSCLRVRVQQVVLRCLRLEAKVKVLLLQGLPPAHINRLMWAFSSVEGVPVAAIVQARASYLASLGQQKTVLPEKRINKSLDGQRTMGLVGLRPYLTAV